MQKPQIVIDYFSDILCVWAYGADIRFQELRATFGEQIRFRYRFIPLFGDTQTRIERDWTEKGGRGGLNKHMLEVGSQWDHIRIHPRTWIENVPASSVPAHLFLSASKLLFKATSAPTEGQEKMHQLVRATRMAFFEDNRDICSTDVLRQLAESNHVDWDGIHASISNGRAHAALHADYEANRTYNITGSPELVLNEGRQKLYGNVGYRILEANIRELLADPRSGEATWC